MKSSEEIQINIKNHVSILETKNDFMTFVYLNDRDQRFGMETFNLG